MSQTTPVKNQAHLAPIAPERMSRIVAATAAASIVLVAGLASEAATFTYSRTASNTALTADQWNQGASWSSSPSAPASAADTTLTFSGALPAGRTIFTNNDIAGNFLLNQFNMNYSGPASGTTPTVTISGNSLEFVNDAAVAPAMTFNTAGSIKPTITLSNNIAVTGNLGISATTNATLSGAISMTGNLGISGAGTATLSGVISGAGSLTRSDTGVAILSGSSSYTGTTSINGGVLRVATLANINTDSSLGKGSAAGSASDLVFGGGTLQYTGSTAQSTDRLFTIGNASGNSATLDGSGTSTGTLNFTNTGTIALANDAAHSLTLTGSLTAGNNLANRSKLAAIITDRSSTYKTSVSKTGASFWELSAQNDYSGGTTISAGVLQSTVANGLGSGAIYVTDTAGAVSLVGVGTYSNPLFITGIGPTINPATVGINPGAIRLGNGTEISGTITLTGNSRISAAGADAAGDAAVISGKITGAYAMQFGTGQNSKSGSLVVSSTENDYTGNTTMAAGPFSTGTLKVSLGNSEVIPNGAGKGNLILSSNNNITFNLNGYSETVNGLVSAGSSGTRVITNTAASTTSTLSLGDGDATAVFAGTIQNGTGTVALTKVGGGTQTLSGTLSYSGATQVNAGTLLIGSTLANSAVTVNAGATLGGTGTLTQTLAVSGAIGNLATVSPGQSVGTLTANGARTFGDYSRLLIELTDDSIDLLAGGSLNLSSTHDYLDINASGWQTQSRYVFATYTGSLGSDILNNVTITGLSGASIDYSTAGEIALVIPEPASGMAMLAVGGLLLIRRRGR